MYLENNKKHSLKFSTNPSSSLDPSLRTTDLRQLFGSLALLCRRALFLYNNPRFDAPVYRYCESRRRVLLQHVHEGYDKDLWEYIED